MFRNYILTAYKVLLRRKFFSFIGLFGIALTLAVLLVLSALLDNFMFPKGPEKNNHNFLIVDWLKSESKDKTNSWSSSPGYYFLDHNVSRLQSPEKVSFYSRGTVVDSYMQGTKVSNKLRHTDIAYWQILDFEFVEGQPYGQQEYDRGDMVMVITQTTAREFFAEQSAIGQSITVSEQRFRVIGVVKDFSSLEAQANADMWVPTTTQMSTEYKEAMMGNWAALLYHSDSDKLKQIQSEFIHLLKNDKQTTDPEKFHVLYSSADKPLEQLARDLTSARGYDSGLGVFIAAATVIVLCFMLLPSINLINLNISRIMERASEIGVRKAFGASSGQLVLQFIIENILITVVGALVGLLMSFVIIWQLESLSLFSSMQLSFSIRTFIYGVVFILMFGLLSGTIPAYKMSKLHPVNALKGGAQSC